MAELETSGHGTLASAHLVLPSRRVARTCVSAILAQYFRRWPATSIAGPASTDLSRVEALIRALGARQQRGDCGAPGELQVLENQHASQNAQCHRGALVAGSREPRADDRRIKTACKALVVRESSKRKLSTGVDSR
jgi:hypothetical protein